jgi:hypothetical protein
MGHFVIMAHTTVDNYWAAALNDFYSATEKLSEFTLKAFLLFNG